jgi:hypothetical protein
MSKLEENAEKFIAYKLVTSVSGIISDRAKRKYEKLGEYIGEKLKTKGGLSEKTNLYFNLKWSDDAANWARKLSLGIEEFKQEFPEYGQILEEKISKHREIRRAYLEYGVKHGDISEEVYTDVIKEVIPGITDSKAKTFYNFLKEVEIHLRKKNKGPQKFLLSE